MCNMTCPFCYSQDQRTVDDLPLDVWIRFMHGNASLVKAINYGTGENTLSRSWYRFVEHVREHYPEIRQALTTNGYLVEAIKDDNKRQAINACIDEIDVSIDFASAEHHDRRRGFTGAFEMAVGTLAYCGVHGKRATIVVLGEEESLDTTNLSRLFELARRYGAFVRINLYRHVSDRSPFQGPSPATVLKALDWIIEHHAVVSVSEPVFNSIYGLTTGRKANGLFSMRILSNGNITPSTYLITKEWVAGNIQNQVFLAEICQTAPFQRFMKGTLPQACEDCPLANTCQGGARDRRFLTWGSLAHPDNYCPQLVDSYAEHVNRPDPKVLRNNDTVHSDYLPTMIFAPGQDGH